LEALWSGYDTEIEDPLILSAHLRRFALQAQEYFDEAKTGIRLSDPSRTPGEEYCAVFFRDLERIAHEYIAML
jgi:hypothetical protein